MTTLAEGLSEVAAKARATSKKLFSRFAHNPLAHRSLASSAPQSPALSPSSAPVKETKHLGTSESLSLPEAHAPPRLMRSYTPETEVLARFLMNLGKGDRVASPRGGANWLVM